MAKPYKVVAQIPQSGRGPTGTYEDGVSVTAQTLLNPTTFQVWVPKSAYNAANVEQLLDAAYSEVQAIGAIGT